MPEAHFRVRWPDDSATDCYSPSSTIREVFVVGKPYALTDFVQLSRRALEHGSERVRQKYGYGCSHAALQIEQIEQTASRFSEDASARVIVEGFYP